MFPLLTAVGSGVGRRMARRLHPYFGFRRRLAPVAPLASDSRGPHEPELPPEQEEGVLWAGFRDDGKIASN